MWGRLFRIFRARSDSVEGSSGFLLDEVREGQSLRDFWWTK